MKSKNLDKLIAQWDRRLAKSGFVDIEDRKTGLLKSWSGYTSIESRFGDRGQSGEMSRGMDVSSVEDLSQAEYYRQATSLLYREDFPKGRVKRVWQLHVEGATLSAIAGRLHISRPLAQYYVDKVRAQYLNIYTGTHKHKKQAR